MTANKASTGISIQNPFTFYYVRDNGWNSTHSYQFWNKNFTTAATVNNTATLKTIYSPSPSGFVEPKTAAFTGFTSTGANSSSVSQFNVSGSYNRGWHFYTDGWKTGITVFFDALGFRDVYSGRSTGIGAVTEVNSSGYYWANGTYSITNSRGLLFGPTVVYAQDGGFVSYGNSCRSVKE